jgi:hypothetical protein
MAQLASPYQAGIAFAEELLPGLDIIPTATIAWVLENTELGQNLNGKAPPSDGSAWPPSGVGDQTPSSGSSWPPPGKPKGDSARSKVAQLAASFQPRSGPCGNLPPAAPEAPPLAQASGLPQRGELLPLGYRREATAAAASGACLKSPCLPVPPGESMKRAEGSVVEDKDGQR